MVTIQIVAMKIGILALQGDFELHGRMLSALSVDVAYIRNTHQLNSCNGLIIPGGDSTTLTKLMRGVGLFDPIVSFSKNKPVFDQKKVKQDLC